jgi:hypothetical protein
MTELIDKEKVIEESVDRYMTLSDRGVKFTKEYLKNRYKLPERDFILNNKL